MIQAALEYQRVRGWMNATTAQLTSDHIKLLEGARAGEPPWEGLSDVISVISCLDDLIAREYLSVDGRAYRITKLGCQFLSALELPGT